MDLSDTDFINKDIEDMSFLPKDYSEPVTSNYMKFEKGQNKFRVLSSAIVGMEYWVTEGDKRKPVRKQMDEPIPVGELETDDRPKHFWAFIVWNYKTDTVQILHITQKTIRTAIKDLVKMEDWGDPKGYDITITRKGDGFDTEYTTLPSNKSKTDEGIIKLYEDMNIDLQKLFSGDDPFSNE